MKRAIDPDQKRFMQKNAEKSITALKAESTGLEQCIGQAREVFRLHKSRS